MPQHLAHSLDHHVWVTNGVSVKEGTSRHSTVEGMIKYYSTAYLKWILLLPDCNETIVSAFRSGLTYREDDPVKVPGGDGGTTFVLNVVVEVW